METEAKTEGPGSGQERVVSVMLAVLVLAVLIGGIKVVAWWLTSSHALLSDAAESLVNVLTGAFGLFSVAYAARPADSSHPYGHGRIEFFSAGLAGVMILLAAAGIARESIPALLDPHPLSNLGTGLGLAVVAALANLLIGCFLIVRGRRRGSLTLVGEGRHLLADTVTTAGVVVGLLLVKVTGAAILDPLAACLVALIIAYNGVQLLREAGGRLMDRQDPRLIARIAQALGRLRRDEWIDIHLLRAWSSGDYVHIDFHLTLPRYWELERVHEAQQELSARLIEELAAPGEVLVHPDPCGANLCSSCRVDPCPLRGDRHCRDAPWSARALALPRHGDETDPCRQRLEQVSSHIRRASP
ncbi:MAG TPA: cation transporter [Acidobacteria bacterium]|nr:cation transporter [Acidobacteriota bacterium]